MSQPPILADLQTEIMACLEAYENGREDRYGFTKLDVLIGQLRVAGEPVRDLLPQAIGAVLPSMKGASAKRWEGLRDIVVYADVKSQLLAKDLEAILSSVDTPKEPRARYSAFMTYAAVGGVLRTSALMREDKLREQLTAQWLDLMAVALKGSPHAIVDVYVTAIKQFKEFDWRHVRRRIPNLIEALGNEYFVQGMLRIIEAFEERVSRENLAAAVDRYNPVGMAGMITRDVKAESHPVHNDDCIAQSQPSQSDRVGNIISGEPMQLLIRNFKRFNRNGSQPIRAC